MWRDIMLSTLAYRWRERKDVKRFERRWLLDVTVDIQNMTIERVE